MSTLLILLEQNISIFLEPEKLNYISTVHYNQQSVYEEHSTLEEALVTISSMEKKNSIFK